MTPDEAAYLLRLARADLKAKQAKDTGQYSKTLMINYVKTVIKKLEHLTR